MSRSGYPVWWDTSLTIYNKFEDAQTNIVSWYKTVVHDCFWKDASVQMNVGNTVLEANQIVCRIPKDERFLSNYLWVALPNVDKESHFTLSPGDIIVLGEVSDVINEYQSGHRATDLKAKYKSLQGCMEINHISINTGIGRCNEHYSVRGI